MTSITKQKHDKQACGNDVATTSVRASSRKNRVYVVREFLLRTFGDYLSKGSTVLDVAGGKGDFSWILTNVDDLNSVVVDPRLTNHSHLIKSVKFLKENPEEAALRATPDVPTHQPLATLIPKLEEMYRTPKHLRLLVDSDLVEAVRRTLQDKAYTMAEWRIFWEKSVERAKQAKTLGYLEDGTSEQQVIKAAEALNIIRSARMIVGFHPDQATEACIDLSLILRVPFCVCPCCVFPSEFPGRRWNGSRVRTYDELIQYLLSKHPSIRTEKLDFHETKTARNVVLYMLPSDIDVRNRNPALVSRLHDRDLSTAHLASTC